MSAAGAERCAPLLRRTRSERVPNAKMCRLWILQVLLSKVRLWRRRRRRGRQQHTQARAAPKSPWGAAVHCSSSS